MDWNKLLSNKLPGEAGSTEIKLREGRSQYRRDFNLIVFSSAFRRLPIKHRLSLPEKRKPYEAFPGTVSK